MAKAGSSMEEALLAMLLRDGGVASIFGDRIWPMVAPQTSIRPYAVIQKASSITDYTMSGSSGYGQARVQIDSYAETYDEAKRGIRLIRTALSGRRTGIFQGIFAETERDLTENNSILTLAVRPYRVSQDFMIHHTGD
jgi:hypothetical protein